MPLSSSWLRQEYHRARRGAPSQLLGDPALTLVRRTVRLGAHPRPLQPVRYRSLAIESLCQSSVQTDSYGVVASDVLRQV